MSFPLWQSVTVVFLHCCRKPSRARLQVERALFVCTLLTSPAR